MGSISGVRKVKHGWEEILWLAATIVAMIGIFLHAFRTPLAGDTTIPLFVFALSISNFYNRLLSKRINALKEFIEQSSKELT